MLYNSTKVGMYNKLTSSSLARENGQEYSIYLWQNWLWITTTTFFSEQSRYFRFADFLCAKNCIRKIWESTRRVSEYFWFTSSRRSLLTASVNINFIYWLIHHVFPFYSSFLASKYKKTVFLFFEKG